MKGLEDISRDSHGARGGKGWAVAEAHRRLSQLQQPLVREGAAAQAVHCPEWEASEQVLK